MNQSRRLCLPYGAEELAFDVPPANLLAVASPNPVEPVSDLPAEIERALREPIGSPSLEEVVRGAGLVVIIADDLTRQTPVGTIIPILLDRLNACGLRDDQVTVLIALGTHRPMTHDEIRTRFGGDLERRVDIRNNPWWDSTQLADLGVTPNGTPVQVSRLALEADVVIGLGSIVPHHIPGYSGGAKIVQPGISGAATTGATHYFSTRTRRSYLGLVENPVRHEMERIADEVGLSLIVNTVLDSDGRVVQAFFGDPRAAFRAGVATSRAVYGVSLPGRADIVVAGSHPCDIEFWQAHKALYPADIAVREGGTIIVVTPCPEGVAVTHGEMLGITGLPATEIERRIEAGEIADVVSGGLALAWSKMRERERVSIVSGGIDAAAAGALGFAPFASVDEALGDAFDRHGTGASVIVMTHAPELLPLLPD